MKVSQTLRITLVWAAAIAWCGLANAAEPELIHGDGEGQGTDQTRISALEKELFQPSLSAAAVASLLTALRDDASRAAAVEKLIAGAAGHQGRIVTFAAAQSDIDVREAAAEVVEALDAAYRTSAAGKKLCALYTRNANQLLGQAWQAFRRDPLDLRATAILVSADPDKVLALVKRGRDSLDPIRFVLLRIREVPKDDWAAKQLRSHSYTSFERAAGSVFPAGDVGNDTAAMRVVGQTLLRQISGARQSGASGIPRLESVSLTWRQVYIFRGKWLGAFRLRVTGFSASGVRALRTPFVRVYRKCGTVAPKGLAVLPRLAIENVHEHHWIQHSMGAPSWAKPLTPKIYHLQIRFSLKRSVEPDPRVLEPIVAAGISGTPADKQPADPGPIKPAPPGSPTVVVLPPRLPVLVTADVRTRALYLCDQLAGGVARTGKVIVVDRAELGRVLAERRLTGGRKNKPALAYDAMLRLEVESAGLRSHASLALVELSSGNLLASWQLDWPVTTVPDAILADIPSHLQRLSRPDSRRMRLRLAGVEPTQVRMAPLGLRLERLFVKMLSKSRDLVLMQHLEAGTSQEEALLLLMGFSRLGGGRQFAPQADATVELRIAELDTIDRTFKDTRIEMAFRLRRAGVADKAWVSFSGTVGGYNALARKAWDALAARLDKVDAGAGRKLMDDLAARRRQAMTEIEAAKRVRREDLRGEALTRAKLAHINAALKIDPLCEEAAYRRVRLLNELYGSHGFRKYSGTKDVHELIFAAARYNDLFPQNPKRTCDVQTNVWIGVRMTPLINMYEGRPVPIDRDLRRLLNAMSRMVEISTSGDPRRLGPACPRFFMTVCRGMRACKVPLKQREAWIDGILAGARKQMTQLKKMKFSSVGRMNFLFHHHWLHVIAATVSAEDGRIERAQKFVQEIQRVLDAADRSSLWHSYNAALVKRLRTVIIKIDDPKALARFDQWVLAKQTPIGPIWFGNLPKTYYSVYGPSKPQGETTNIVYAPNRPIALAPLCAGDGYMYIVVRNDPNDIAWGHMRGFSGGSAVSIIIRVPLDGTGRPKGKNVASRWPRGPIPVWDTIETLPQPKVRKNLHVLSALFIDGKLYLGTMYSGLLVFDAKDKTWTVVDPAAGQPCWAVFWLHDRGDGTLLCIGRDMIHGSDSFCFSYARKDGRIRVLRKTDRKRQIYVYVNVFGSWENAGRVMTIVTGGLREDILSDKPKLRKFTDVRTPGWKRDSDPYAGLRYFARVGQRLFVKVHSGLLELDTSGAVKERIFTGGPAVLPGMSEHWLLTSVDVPNPTPGTGAIVSDGRYLWFTGSRVLYDPKQRLWYGPLTKSKYDARAYSIATPAGLWAADGDKVAFIDRDKFMAAARAADRVTTTKEYVKRRDRAIAEQTAPVPHARILLALRQLKQARDVLEAHLRDHADDPHAVLLMGMVCDAWGLKDLRRAEDCYRKLEQWPDPKVRFTGMYMRLHLLVRQRRWADAAALLKTCRKNFCWVQMSFERDLAALEKQIGKHAPGRAPH